MSIDRRVMALMILASLVLPAAGLADRLELVGFDVVEFEDALERSASEKWLEHAETGQRVIEGLDFLLVISPDSKWMLLGQPIEAGEGEGGLDVVTYRLFIMSTTNPQLISLVDQAGLENHPCWVSQWSNDGKVLIIHQQFSFDDSSAPRAWRVKLK